MKWVIYLFGVFLIAAGVILFIDENIVLGYITSNQESSWLYFFAVVMRLVMGAALIRTASISRFPLVFKIIGYIALAAAFIFLIIGHDRFISVMTTLIPYFENTGGWVGIFALAFGVFLIYGLKK